MSDADKDREVRVYLTGCALIGMLSQARDTFAVVAEDAIAQADETIRQLNGQRDSGRSLSPKSSTGSVK